MYTYKIFHEYQIGDQSVLFRSPISPDQMRDLLASLQFHFEEYINEDEILCERAATEIIHTLHDPVEYLDSAEDPIIINTYVNREERCGEAFDLIRRYYTPITTDVIKVEQANEGVRLKREIPELREAE